jgi:tungstate transport system permease protein
VQDFLQAARSALALIGSLDPEFIGIVGLSLGISLSASVIAMIVGALFGGVLAVARLHGRQTIIVLANALLGLPPVAVGLTIYLLLSRSGPLGFAGLLFTPAAMIIAQVVLTTPIVIALVHRPAADVVDATTIVRSCAKAAPGMSSARIATSQSRRYFMLGKIR